MEIIELGVSGMHCDSCVERVKSAVCALAGVEGVDVGIGSVRVEYYPEAVTRAQIAGAIEAAGYALVDIPVARGPVNRFLDRMTRTNQELFGNQRLDCCTFNRK
jgi:copper chaperone CopZ